MTAVCDTGLRCLSCQYNLTGLSGDICPECGAKIDWDLLRADPELRRVGTPAHRANGWRIVPGTIDTVLLMLLHPWRFAARLRVDESLWPALGVALVAFGFCVAWLCVLGGLPNLDEILSIAAAPTSVIIVQSLAFATLSTSRGSPVWRWRHRFRTWVVVSLYSSCFIAAWVLVRPRFSTAPQAIWWNVTNFHWPLNKFGYGTGIGTPALFVSIIYYWWWFILGSFLLVRNRPRWLAGCSVLLVFPFSVLGARVFLWLAG